MRRRIHINICSTVHSHDDPRIFHRQALTLANEFDISLFICAHFKFKVIKPGLRIYGLPIWHRKIDRIKNILILIIHLIKSKKQVFIFHDPELLIIIPFIKLLSKSKIIYDIHENYREMISEKDWIPKKVRNFSSFAYSFIERFALLSIDMIWYPVEDINKYYLNLPDRKKMLVPNIPKLSHFDNLETEKTKKRDQFIYIGTMVEDRGIIELIKGFAIFSLNNPDYKLLLLGPFKSETYKVKVIDLINKLNLNQRISFKIVPYDKVPKYLAESKVGLLNFLPFPNNVHGLPNKLFEYLAMGLPVIASDFPNYRNIISKENVGVCVNPTIPKDIARAMQKLAENDNLRINQGKNGKSLVQHTYNWDVFSKEIVKGVNGIMYDV